MTVSITIDKSDNGRFRAMIAGREIEASTLGHLLEDLGRVLSDTFSMRDPETDAGGPDDDAGFEADLEYTLRKNQELYRRLAR